MAQRRGQLLAVVGEKLRIVRTAQDGNLGHAVVEQVFRAQLRVHIEDSMDGPYRGHGFDIFMPPFVSVSELPGFTSGSLAEPPAATFQ